MSLHFLMFLCLVFCTFGSVVLLLLGLVNLFFKHHVESRLAQVLGESSSAINPNGEVLGHRWNAVLESLSKLSLPKEGWQNSNVHLRFLRAGIRGSHAPKIYYALKSILTLAAPLLVAMIT